MRELTKQERHEVYIEALGIYQRSKGIGLCRVLKDVVWGLGFGVTLHLDIPELFPEFWAYRSPDMDHREALINFWWSTKDRKSRERVLRELIEKYENNRTNY